MYARADPQVSRHLSSFDDFMCPLLMCLDTGDLSTPVLGTLAAESVMYLGPGGAWTETS